MHNIQSIFSKYTNIHIEYNIDSNAFKFLIKSINVTSQDGFNV